MPPGGWTRRGMAVGRPLDAVEVLLSTGTIVPDVVVVGGGVVVGAKTSDVGRLMLVSVLVAVGTIDTGASEVVHGTVSLAVVSLAEVSLGEVSLTEEEDVSLVVEISSVVVEAYEICPVGEVMMITDIFEPVVAVMEGRVETLDAPEVIDAKSELVLSLGLYVY